VVGPVTTSVEVEPGVLLEVDVWPEGSGRPVVALHGLASNRRLWHQAAQELAGLGHPVATFDQRGHGASSRPPGGYSTTAAARDLVEVVARLDREWGFGRPVLAGQSWGANVVVQAACDRPGLAWGTVLVDGGLPVLSEAFPSWEACRHALAPPRLELAGAEELARLLRRERPDWPEAALGAVLASFEEGEDGSLRPRLAFERHMAILRSMWDQPLAEQLAGLQVPVVAVVAAGRDDPAWAAAKRRAVEQAGRLVARWRTHWVCPAGHDLHAERPGELAALLDREMREGVLS
jgi:pimeloyl-ACP methyl ester carboxylesterase